MLCCIMLCVPPGTVEDALLRWLRAAELTCDRAALLVAQDPAVVIGALMKLAGGSPAFAHELSVDAFLEQVCTPTLRARTDNMPRSESLLVPIPKISWCWLRKFCDPHRAGSLLQASSKTRWQHLAQASCTFLEGSVSPSYGLAADASPSTTVDNVRLHLPNLDDKAFVHATAKLPRTA
jgi:hypothetical protein